MEIMLLVPEPLIKFINQYSGLIVSQKEEN